MNINIEAEAQELLAMANYMRGLGRLHRAAELDTAAAELSADNSKRGYYINEDAEVAFGLYGEEVFGDFRAEWNDLGIKITVYDDCLFAMANFADLWAALAKYDRRDITQAQFVKELRNCGFEGN